MKTGIEASGHQGIEESVLTEIRQQLVGKLGKRLRLMTLFGSRARGDSQDESDVDLLIVVQDRSRPVLEAIEDIIYEAMTKTGFVPFIAPIVMDERHFRFLEAAKSSFISNVLSEGKKFWESRQDPRFDNT